MRVIMSLHLSLRQVNLLSLSGFVRNDDCLCNESLEVADFYHLSKALAVIDQGIYLHWALCMLSQQFLNLDIVQELTLCQA